MELRHLRDFVAVAEELHFVEAAADAAVLPDVLGFFRMHLPNIGVARSRRGDVSGQP